MASTVNAVISETMADLSPALLSGSFLSFLAALTVHSYTTDAVKVITDMLMTLLPTAVRNVFKMPQMKLVNILISLLLALAIVGGIYAFVIEPVYRQSIADAKANGNANNAQ